jgi:hypothetical protein
MPTENSNSSLYDFAFCGSKDYYNNTALKYLAGIAEKEIWSFHGSDQYDILGRYIYGTFARCSVQNKIIYSADREYCCFNTGLLTENGKDIIMVFDKNTIEGFQKWHLKGFFDQSDRSFMAIFKEIPPLATYTDNYTDFYFNPMLNIEINTDHILDDNWDRIQEVVHMSKTIMKSLLVGVVEESKKKVLRNLRLVIPQFYQDEIMYLFPIRIPVDDNKYETMALAVQKIQQTNQYRANTIFTKEMAYEKARLIARPESNWLISEPCTMQGQGGSLADF